MFRWILRTLPVDIARGWRLIRVDLTLWCTVTLGLAWMTHVGLQRATETPTLVILAAASVLAIFVLMALRFDAATGGRSSSWPEVFERTIHRTPLLLFTIFAAVAVSSAAAAVLRVAIVLVIDNHDVAVPVATAAWAVVYLSLLTGFCLAPFLAVLDRQPQTAQANRFARSLGRLSWPLQQSRRLTDGRRLSLAPYVAIISIGPIGAGGLPPRWQLPLLALWQLTTILAQAILFDYYRKQRDFSDTDRQP